MTSLYVRKYIYHSPYNSNLTNNKIIVLNLIVRFFFSIYYWIRDAIVCFKIAYNLEFFLIHLLFYTIGCNGAISTTALQS